MRPSSELSPTPLSPCPDEPFVGSTPSQMEKSDPGWWPKTRKTTSWSWVVRRVRVPSRGVVTQVSNGGGSDDGRGALWLWRVFFDYYLVVLHRCLFVRFRWRLDRIHLMFCGEMDCKEILSWPEEDDCLQKDSGNDIAHCLWDELNQEEDSLLYMLGEQTPAKESMDFAYHEFDNGGSAVNSFELYRESSIVKRRRMLQFDPSDPDITNCSNGAPSIANSKVREECSLLSNELSENLNLASGCAGSGSSLGDESLAEPLGDWWPQGCLNESDLQYNCDELISFGPSDDPIDVSEFCNLSAAVETPNAPQVTTPSPRIKFKVGRKSPIKAPTSPASVAYPFELFKPSVVQGDVTLSDINRRIHSPPPYKLPCIKQKELAFRYPTSAISGKPVVAKTKIRTEGGRGSITITRTKG